MYYYLALRATLMKQEEGSGGFWGGSVIEYMCDSGTGVFCLQSHTVYINHAVKVQSRHYSYTSSGLCGPKKY